MSPRPVPTPPAVLALLLTLALALSLGACGPGSATNGSSDQRSGTTSGELRHADGTLAVSGERLTLTPTSAGSEPLELELGPEVEPGAVQALAASGARARVFYLADDDIAASVVVAPELGADAEEYTGEVTQVDRRSITIDGPAGERTFAIEADDADAFDVDHLTEHRSAGEPVRVQYRTVGERDVALSYEDA